ncbi:MAG: hypothetical protein COA42_23370 [Alteromonadaceae bacterium]|nr:MAG: hypothetical protein COA42_23370 [Alteromonadaceae bacterium]
MIKNQPYYFFLAYTALVFALLCPRHSYSDITPAEVSIDDISDRVQQANFLSGAFTQSRTLKGLTRPLISSGKFNFWRSEGLYWGTEKPFFSAATYKSDRVIGWTKQGLASSESVPNQIQKRVGKILLQIISSDVNALTKDFKVISSLRALKNTDNTDNLNPWKIELTPKQAITKKFIHTLTLVGDQFLQEVRIRAANGDETKILFSDTQAADAPNLDQCKLFLSSEKTCQ